MSVTLSAKAVHQELKKHRNPEKAKFFPRFFKAGPGEYAEGDQFIGVIVPDQRKIAKKFKALPLREIEALLDNPFHECRLTGVLILVGQYQKTKDPKIQKDIYNFYLKKIDQINNWDLVDSSAHKIVGPYLADKNRKPLYTLAKAKHLWKNRVAMIATYFYIKNNDLADTLAIAEILLNHKHDLIHKAVGWMLREAGKQDKDVLLGFIEKYGSQMPRTMLRYAIEKLPENKRKAILKSTSANGKSARNR